jgi:hypothetical protein
MHQHDQRSLSGEGHPQPNAVGLNRGEFRLYGHGVSPVFAAVALER